MKAFLEYAPKMLQESCFFHDDPSHQQVWKEHLGWGEMYYAWARWTRPDRIVVIGSARGFVPILFGLACVDNGHGHVHFIDPGFWDDFWQASKGWFETWGVGDVVSRYQLTTEGFTKCGVYETLARIGILFIDGSHTYQAARYDHAVFRHKMVRGGTVFFHDSRLVSPPLYESEDEWAGVWRYVAELPRVFELQEAPGLAIYREIHGPFPPETDLEQNEWTWRKLKSMYLSEPYF